MQDSNDVYDSILDKIGFLLCHSHIELRLCIIVCTRHKAFNINCTEQHTQQFNILLLNNLLKIYKKSFLETLIFASHQISWQLSLKTLTNAVMQGSNDVYKCILEKSLLSALIGVHYHVTEVKKKKYFFSTQISAILRAIFPPILSPD